MKCPFCGHDDTRVIDSRPSEDGSTIRRRRNCENCQKRFTTYEKVETMPLIVIKKDGSRQTFDREKLIERILRACHKRKVSITEIEKLADEIENAALSSMNKEISTSEIGEKVLMGLWKMDEVAYIRFASVYREFADLDSFLEDLDRMRGKQE
ncbi:MAG: transcriptional repressor NrdR [Firmicutes bacterium]|nr:transcriptional repressor NrdR [Bacillota bacterium]